MISSRNIIAIFVLFFFCSNSELLSTSMKLYGTFHAMGITIELNSGEDPEEDAITIVEYRETGGVYKNGIPLSALEVRDEYLKNKAADIVLAEGPDRKVIIANK